MLLLVVSYQGDVLSGSHSLFLWRLYFWFLMKTEWNATVSAKVVDNKPLIWHSSIISTSHEESIHSFSLVGCIWIALSVPRLLAHWKFSARFSLPCIYLAFGHLECTLTCKGRYAVWKVCILSTRTYSRRFSSPAFPQLGCHFCSLRHTSWEL